MRKFYLFYATSELVHQVNGQLEKILPEDKTSNDPRWVSVTFEPIETFKNPISLQKIKNLKE